MFVPKSPSPARRSSSVRSSVAPLTRSTTPLSHSFVPPEVGMSSSKLIDAGAYSASVPRTRGHAGASVVASRRSTTSSVARVRVRDTPAMFTDVTRVPTMPRRTVIPWSASHRSADP